MPIITLTTDLGLKDHYVASLKGSIYKEIPEVNIVDISHEIEKFNISQAAFVLKNCFADFPSGTIHIIAVRPERIDSVKVTIDHIIVENKGQYFIGADNGIFSLIFDQSPDQVFEIDLRESPDGYLFPTKDIFVKAACHLARGGTPQVIGLPKDSFNERKQFSAIEDPSSIRGMVIYIDSYGNVITNITKKQFIDVGKGRPFSITFGKSRYQIDEIKSKYTDSVEGELLALFGSSGQLEIAIAGDNAENLVGLHLTNYVTISFYDR